MPRSLILALALLLMVAAPVSADHSLGFKWGGRAPITVNVRSELTDPGLQASLERAIALWSESPVIDMRLVTKGKKMVTVEQWDMGEGSIAFAVPSNRGFRLTGVLVVVNEHYLTADSPLNLSIEENRDWVLCHELGHALGLDHRREGSGCLYTGGIRTTPDEHDYAMLLELYQ